MIEYFRIPYGPADLLSRSLSMHSHKPAVPHAKLLNAQPKDPIHFLSVVTEPLSYR